MPLNLADRMAVRPLIIPRCAARVVQLCNYYLGGGDPQDPPTEQQLGWAREAIRQPTAIGEQVSYHVLNLTAFIDDGSGIDDATLGNEVEAKLKSHFIPSA